MDEEEQEKTSASELLLLSAMGALIGVLAFSTILVIWEATLRGSGFILAFIPVIIALLIFSLFTAIPLGWLIGLFVSLTGPIDYPRAIFTGAATAVLLLVFNYESTPPLAAILAIAALGAFSGALALRETRRINRSS